MRNKIVALMISIISIFLVMPVVNAEVRENAFTNEECISNSGWEANARTGYKLNTSTGVYSLTDDYYDDAPAEDIYYTVSSDGKILYAYVPNYNKTIANSSKQDNVYDAGIISNYSCNGVLKVSKNIIGSTAKTLSGKDQVDLTLKANTFSVVSVASIIFGLLLVALAVYFYLKRTGKLPKKNNPEDDQFKFEGFSFILALGLFLIPFTVNAVSINLPKVSSIDTSKYEPNSVTLSWNSGNSGAGFYVEASNLTDNKTNRFANSVTSYTYKGLTSGKTYSFKIRVCSSKDVCSNWTSEVSATPTNVVVNPTDSPSSPEDVYKIKTEVGDSTRLNKPNYDGEITWESSDPNIASVDEDGNVTSNKDGYVTILAKDEDGNVIGSYNVKVGNGDASSYKGVKIGETTSLSVPSGHSACDLTWESFNPTIAEVDECGKMKTLSSGFVTIVAKDEDGNVVQTYKYYVSSSGSAYNGGSSNNNGGSSNGGGSSSGASCPSGSTLASNGYCTSSSTYDPSCGSGYTYNSTSKKCVNNTDSDDFEDPDCKDGYVLNPSTNRCVWEPVPPTCTNGTYNMSTKRCDYNIDDSTKVQSLSWIDGTSDIELKIGDTKQLAIEKYPEDSTTQIHFEVGNSSVAKVDSSGMITAVGKGRTYVIASADYAYTGSLWVEVIDPNEQAKDIEIVGDDTVPVGGIINFTAKTNPEGLGDNVRWEVEGEYDGTSGAATITEYLGLFTAEAPGKVLVTAYSKDNPDVKDTKVVTITSKLYLKCNWESTEELDLDSNENYKCSLKTSDEEDAPDVTSGVSWNIESDKLALQEESMDIASIDQSGALTLKHGGTGWVVATYTNLGKTVSGKYRLKIDEPVTGGKIVEHKTKAESGTLTVSNGTIVQLEFTPSSPTASGEIGWALGSEAYVSAPEILDSSDDDSAALSLFKTSDTKYLTGINITNTPEENEKITVYVTVNGEKLEGASYDFTVDTKGFDRETACENADVCLAPNSEYVFYEGDGWDDTILSENALDLEWTSNKPAVVSEVSVGNTKIEDETGTEKSVKGLTIKSGEEEGFAILTGDDPNDPDDEEKDEDEGTGSQLDDDFGIVGSGEDTEAANNADGYISVYVIKYDEDSKDDTLDEFKESNLNYQNGYKINGGVKTVSLDIGKSVELKLTNSNGDPSAAGWTSRYETIAQLSSNKTTVDAPTTRITGKVKGCTVVSANSTLFNTEANYRAQIIVKVGMKSTETCSATDSGTIYTKDMGRPVALIGTGKTGSLLVYKDHKTYSGKDIFALEGSSCINFSDGSFGAGNCTIKTSQKVTATVGDKSFSTKIWAVKPASISIKAPSTLCADKNCCTTVVRTIKGSQNANVWWGTNDDITSFSNEYYYIKNGGSYLADSARQNLKKGKSYKYGVKICGTGKTTSSTKLYAQLGDIDGSKAGYNKSKSFAMSNKYIKIKCEKEKVKKGKTMICTITTHPKSLVVKYASVSSGASVVKLKAKVGKKTKKVKVKKVKKGKYKVKIKGTKKKDTVTLTVKDKKKKVSGKYVFKVTS